MKKSRVIKTTGLTFMVASLIGAGFATGTALADGGDYAKVDKQGVAASLLIANDPETIEWVKTQPLSPDLASAYTLNKPVEGVDNNAYFCAADNGKTSPSEVNVTYSKPKVAKEWAGTTFDPQTKKAVKGKTIKQGTPEYGALAYLHSTAYLPTNMTSKGLQATKTAQEVISGVLSETSPNGQFYKNNKQLVDKIIELAKEQRGPYKLEAKGGNPEIKTWADGTKHVTLDGFTIKTATGKNLDTGGITKLINPNFSGEGIQHVQGKLTLGKGMKFDNIPNQQGVDGGKYEFSYFTQGEDKIEISVDDNLCEGKGDTGIKLELQGLPTTEIQVIEPQQTPETNPELFKNAVSLSGAQTLAVLGLTIPTTGNFPLCKTSGIKIGTTAVWEANGKKTINANATEKFVIKDTVSFNGLTVTPGKKYTLRGSVQELDSKNEIVKENVVTAESQFEPEKSDGVTDVNFELKKDQVKPGAKFVVFEELVNDEGKTIATHRDKNDEGQTVTTVGENEIKIGTTAVWAENGEKTIKANATEKFTIKDTVSFSGLTVTPGKKYTLRGSVQELDSNNEIVKENVVTAESQFEPEKSDGVTDVNFELKKDQVKPGAKFVVFEELVNDEGKTIATHRDKDDTNQTVSVEEEKNPPLAKTGAVALMALALCGVLTAAGIVLVSRRRMLI